MEKNATIYILDPETATFSAVEMPTDNGFAPLYAALACQVIETLHYDDRHVIFFDEDGLRNGLAAFTTLDGHPQPLAGKLALACHEAEPFATPLLSIGDVAKRFQCARPLLDPVFDTEQGSTESGIAVRTKLRGFQTRIEKTTPTIVP